MRGKKEGKEKMEESVNLRQWSSRPEAITAKLLKGKLRNLRGCSSPALIRALTSCL